MNHDYSYVGKIDGCKAYADVRGAMIALANKKNQSQWKIIQINGWFVVQKA